MCIFWPYFKPRGITMEGSSESAWQKSDSSRGLNTSAVSDRNLVLPPQEKESDRVLLVHNDHLRNQIDLSRVFEDGATAEPVIHDIEWGDVSLRQWLSRPERSVDVFECLHIFRQIVEIVNAAHSQGVVVHNVRPSCFVMSSFSRVSFIESASCSDSGSDSLEDELNNQTMELKEQFSVSHMREQRSRLGFEDLTPAPDPTRSFSEASCMQSSSAYGTNASLAQDVVEKRIRDWGNVEQVDEKKQSFPMKQILLLETSWYTSPEELTGGPSSYSSDIYRLGVLLFELFCPFSSREAEARTMSSLRHRVLPPQLLLGWPKEATFCLWLLHPEPTCRPKMSELLQSEFLNEPRDNLEERKAAIELREKIEEQELLLEFLMLVKQRKQEAADKLQDTVSFLCSDIGEVIGLLKFLKKKRGSPTEHGKDDHAMSNLPSSETGDNGDFAGLGSRKRFRPGVNMEGVEDYDDNLEDAHNSDSLVAQDQESILLKSSRLMKNFKKLESAYFLTRCRPTKASRKPLNVHSPISSDGRGSVVVTERSSVSNLASKEQYSNKQGGWITPFVEGLCKYLSFSKLRVKADLKQGDLLNSSNLVCSLSFDRDGEFFATAGVNKKIKVFECDTIINETRDIHYPVVEMFSRSKLSSICWNSYIKSQIASSNFEGVVQVWDVTRSQVLTEMREHERRVWSIDFSSADPTMLASGSDDGCVKLWSINQGVSIGTIKTKANVCCVQFPMDSCRNLAFGSADHKIYYYDLRNSRVPLCTFVGHNKTVSYVKFVDAANLVSASTDNSLKLWDLSLSTSRVVDTPLQSFTGHTNVKNFVGLSASNGYIATGSESNEVFVYHKAFPMPALSFKFQSTDPLSGLETDDAAHFISSVCWRSHSSIMVAANSTGNIKVLEMV